MEQDEDVPPYVPVQLQFHGQLPVTAVALPLLQRSATGAAASAAPLLDPQLPLIIAENWASTARAPFMVIEQLPVPLQAPVQPVKSMPLSGVAVSVTASVA